MMFGWLGACRGSERGPTRYLNDVIQLDWPTDFEVPAAMHRNMYCKPCGQKVVDDKTHENFN